jgi:hypothetical protein
MPSCAVPSCRPGRDGVAVLMLRSLHLVGDHNDPSPGLDVPYCRSVTRRCTGVTKVKCLRLSYAGATSAIASADALSSLLLCRRVTTSDRPCLRWRFEWTCNLMCPCRYWMCLSLWNSRPSWRSCLIMGSSVLRNLIHCRRVRASSPSS